MKTFILIILIFLYSKNLLSYSLFDTDFYEINFSSNNIEQDKNKKISSIKLESINSIFRNILINEDLNFIKRNINEELINIFIKNILIEDEKIINNIYSSKVKINFNKKEIINYLRDTNLPYVEYIPKDFLIIIYEMDQISNNLFSKNNLHYKFLLENENLFPFYKIPNLDLNDRYLLNTNNINFKDLDKIAKFTNKYSKNESIIIISKKNESDIKYTIYYYVNEDLVKIDDFLMQTYDYVTLFNNLKKKIINHWKIENKIDNNKFDTIICEISYYNLLELKQIKNYLNNISSIKNISLKTISLNKNKYKIYFYGEKKILSNLFKLNNLDIKINSKTCDIYLK